MVAAVVVVVVVLAVVEEAWKRVSIGGGSRDGRKLDVYRRG